MRKTSTTRHRATRRAAALAILINAATTTVANAAVLANTAAAITRAIQDATNSTLTLTLPENSIVTLAASQITVTPSLRLTIESTGVGAVIDAASLSRAFHLRAHSQLTLRRVSIRNGAVADATGGCILVDPLATLRIYSAELRNCLVNSSLADPDDPTSYKWAANGGAVAARGATLVLADTTIRDAHAVDGGAIFASGCELTLDRVHISDCSASREAGALGLLSSTASIKDSTIKQTAATLGGGALYVADGTEMLLHDSLIAASTAGDVGGALAIASDAVAGLERTILANCTAARGGAISVDNARLRALGSRIEGSSASNGGGGVHVDSGGVDLVATSVRGCSAEVKGGGILARDSALRLTDTRVVECSTAGDGGGVALSAGTLAWFSGSTIDECSVMFARGRGSALQISYEATAHLSSTTVSRSHSQMYGTIYVEGHLGMFNDSAIADCRAVDLGGSSSAAVARRGGVLWVRRHGSVVLVESQVRNCTAEYLGVLVSDMEPRHSFAPISIDPGGGAAIYESSFVGGSPRAVYVSKDGTLNAALLTLSPPCIASGDDKYVIHAEDGAQVSLFDLHAIESAAECRREPAELAARLVSDSSLVATCSGGGGSDDDDDAESEMVAVAMSATAATAAPSVCPVAAICNDAGPVTVGGQLRSAGCACDAPNVPNPAWVWYDEATVEGTRSAPFASSVRSDFNFEPSAALQPYLGGCLTPRTGIDVSVASANADNVFMELTKTASQQNASRTLVLQLDGTQQSPLAWHVDPATAPSWLRVEPMEGVIDASVGDIAAIFTVLASSEGLREARTPYSAHLSLHVHGAQPHTIDVPIYVIVAVTTSAATSGWGEAIAMGSADDGGGDNEAPFLCARDDALAAARNGSFELVVGEDSQEIVFTACDVEGLRVAHSLPSIRTPDSTVHSPQAFEVTLVELATNATATMLYTYLERGRYEANVRVERTGAYDLQLSLDGEPSGLPLRVMGVCPASKVALDDGLCGCAAGYEPSEFGVCRACTLGTFKNAAGNEACSSHTWPIPVAISGGAAGALLCFFLFILGRRSWLRQLQARATLARERDKKLSRIVGSITGVARLKYPLCVMRLPELRKQGRLVTHEQARDANLLSFCDDWEAAVAFASRKSIVFVSHQWLSRSEPDPENAHYPSIVAAADALCAEHAIDPDDMHIWLDFHSIPQRNDSIKWSAIESIPAYAARSHFFLACAPLSTHQSTGERCDADSYLARGWCRLEQWAFLAINGSRNMYVFDERGLTKMGSDWIRKSVDVFSGAFSCPNDRSRLVDVVLGLYGLSCAALATVSAQVRHHHRRHHGASYSLGESSSFDGGGSGCTPSDSSHGSTVRITTRATCCSSTEGQAARASIEGVDSCFLDELIADRRGNIFPASLFDDLIPLLEEELELAARGDPCAAFSHAFFRKARKARARLCSTAPLQPSPPKDSRRLSAAYLRTSGGCAVDVMPGMCAEAVAAAAAPTRRSVSFCEANAVAGSGRGGSSSPIRRGPVKGRASRGSLGLFPGTAPREDGGGALVRQASLAESTNEDAHGRKLDMGSIAHKSMQGVQSAVDVDQRSAGTNLFEATWSRLFRQPPKSTTTTTTEEQGHQAAPSVGSSMQTLQV